MAREAPILPVAHWRLRQRLAEVQRRFQRAAGCITASCGAQGMTGQCDACRHELAVRLRDLGELARVDPEALALQLLLDAWERADASLYGGAA